MQNDSKEYIVSYGKDTHLITLKEARQLIKARVGGKSMVLFEDKALSTSFLWLVSELKCKMDRATGTFEQIILLNQMRKQTDKLIPTAASKVLPNRKVEGDNEN